MDNKFKILLGATTLLFSSVSSASVISISGDFIFDAGNFPDIYGQDASIKTGQYSFLFDPQSAIETLYTGGLQSQTSNYGDSILGASVDFAGVKYETTSGNSLLNTIAVWDEYNAGRDRINFLIGLGSISAGFEGVSGDEIIRQGVSYLPQNDVSVSSLRTVMKFSLYADDFNAIASTDLPPASDFEALFSSTRNSLEISSLYGSDGTFLDIGGGITTVNASSVPAPSAILLLVTGLLGLGIARRRVKG